LKRGISFYSSFFLCLILSCSDTRNLEIGVSKTLKLEPKEMAIPLNKIITKEYETIVNCLPISLPLNKYVKSPAHGIYIGVAMDSNLQSLNQMIEKNTSMEILDKKQANDVSIYLVRKNQQPYIFLTQPDQYPLLLIWESKDSTSIQKLFYENNLLSRLF
jgi:hypothetical protein